MWVFTKHGFVSAVQNKHDSNEVLVRARDRRSLAAVADATGGSIVHTRSADYPYRLSIHKAAFAEWMLAQVDGIDYANFKDTVVVTRGADYERHLMTVWSVMHQTEDREARMTDEQIAQGRRKIAPARPRDKSASHWTRDDDVEADAYARRREQELALEREQDVDKEVPEAAPDPDPTAPTELSHQTKVMLSWMTAAYVLQWSSRPLLVQQYLRHPDDLLALVDGRDEVANLNRAGRDGFFRGVATDIWVTAGMTPGKGPRDLAMRLLDECGIRKLTEARAVPAAQAAAFIGNWLAVSEGDTKVASGTDGWGSAYVDAFDRSAEWLDREPPPEGTDPAAWLFVLAFDGEPAVLVDLKTGERTTNRLDGVNVRWGNAVGTWRLENGELGCPVAMRVILADPTGAVVQDFAVRVGFTRFFARGLREDYMRHTVTVKPIYEVPAEGFRFTAGDIPRVSSGLPDFDD